MALSKALAVDNDVINIFEAEGAEEVVMGIDPKRFGLVLNHLIDAYTKPIDATVREVISNADDATVLLPITDRRPIEITSPSTFKPSFTVRDYGVGMTPEIVKKTYLQFGGTTKEDDFSQIGSKGLGAKSPLAYCSEFNVSTTRDGVTTDILVSRKAAGAGAKIIGVRQTDEPNGTIVTIPVRMQDRAEFVAAMECYKKYSFNSQMSIDGVISDNTENYLHFDEIFLDEESGTKGRVWVNKAALVRLFKNSFNRNNSGYRQDTITSRYSLSGWIYSDPDQNDGYYRRNDNNYDVIIELKPGIVDFSTSRDEITKNDRSKALAEVASASITKNPEYVFNNVMKTYSDLTDRQAYLFASELIELIDPVKTTETKVYLGRDKTTMSFDVAEFTTATGFNPFDLILKRHKKEIVAIVGYGHASYSILQDSLPGAKDELLKSRPEIKMFYRSEAWSAGGDRRVGTLNSHLVELFEDGARKESLVDHVAEVSRIQRSGNVSFTVVTGADDKNIRKINARRKLISEKVLTNNILFITNLDKISQDQIDAVSHILTAEINFITADELIEKANEVRKELTKLNPPSDPAGELFNLSKIDISSATTKSSVVDAVTKRAHSAPIALDELIASNAILLIGDQRHHRNTLIGAANAGIDIVGREIYLTDRYTSFRAPHYDKLKDYDGALVSREWNYNSASFAALFARSSFYETALNEEIAKLSDEKIVSMYIISKTRNCGIPFLKFLESSATDDPDNAIYSLITKAAIADEYPQFSPDFLLKVLNKNLGEDRARKVRAFVEATGSFRSGTFTDGAVMSLLRFGGSILPGESMAHAARDAFIEKYRSIHERILADEAAALAAAAEVVNSADLSASAV